MQMNLKPERLAAIAGTLNDVSRRLPNESPLPYRYFLASELMLLGYCGDLLKAGAKPEDLPPLLLETLTAASQKAQKRFDDGLSTDEVRKLDDPDRMLSSLYRMHEYNPDLFYSQDAPVRDRVIALFGLPPTLAANARVGAVYGD
jgi:hypothetical protein